MSVGTKQIDLINISKKYLERINLLNIDVANSAFCWLLSLPGVPGYFTLKNLQRGKKFSISQTFFVLKQLLAVSILYDYKILNKITSVKNFDRLMISWAIKTDFNKDGSYKARYFKQISQDDKKNIWFLIYLDETVPEKVDDNIIIFGKENLRKKYNFFYFIKVFLKIILKYRGSIVKTLHFCSRSSHFAEIISKEITKLVKEKNFKDILLPYEAQPFQNTVFKEIKKINDKIKLIGYLHSAQPFPSYYIYRDGAPDLLLSHSTSQIFHLKEYLHWPENKLKLVPSLRYQNKDREKYNNKLVLPIILSGEEILLNKLRSFLKQAKKESLHPVIVRNHPFSEKSKVHKKFIKNLNQILLEYNSRFSNNAKNDIAIFFGGTSAVLEALESGLKVVHICSDVVFESYTEVFWPSIKVDKIDENIIQYELKSFGECINFGSEENILKKYYN